MGDELILRQRKEIGLKIAQRRQELDLTRKALADKLEPPISDKYLWQIEDGQPKVSAEMLRRIAIALDVSTDWLLGLADKKADEESR